MTKKYDLRCGDMYGRNDEATNILNNKFIPMIKKMGINTEKNLDNIVKVLRNIVEEACSNARLETEWEINSGEGV